MSYDIVIKGGTIVDGSGGPRYRSDLGIKDGRIAAFGRIRDSAATVIDAEGLVVAPGFVDAHTHMDAQVFWDPLGTGSIWHGVTSVVMGNCGFTLAPCHPEDKESFMRALEAVEDIPTASMLAGIDWTWGSYRDYLARVEALPKGINYGGYAGHTAIRRYVMGERAFTEVASEEDIAAMRRELADALAAGALGFTTSRGPHHVTPDRQPVPSRIAAWSEIEALVGLMGELNTGIFEIARERPGTREGVREFMDRLKALAVSTGVPLTYGLQEPVWLDFLDEVAEAGGRAVGQVILRTGGTHWSFQTHLPYDGLPVWKELRSKPLEEQKALLRDPELRRRLVAAAYEPPSGTFVGAEARPPEREGYRWVRVLQDPYGPNPTVAEIAEREGKDPVEVVIDLSLASDFEQLFQQQLSGQPGQQPKDDDGEAFHLVKLRHPRTVPTFTDSGAHVSQIVDYALQTHLLAYWVRRKQALTLEEAVRRITFDIANAWGLHDRGLLRVGLAADVVVFDPERLDLEMTQVSRDLPAGAKRLTQKAKGYHATIVNGEVVMRDGRATGAFPGTILRGPRVRQPAAIA